VSGFRCQQKIAESLLSKSQACIVLTLSDLYCQQAAIFPPIRSIQIVLFILQPL